MTKRFYGVQRMSGIATVDANGIVTTKGKGTTYIYAKCTSDGYGMDGNGTPAVGMIKT